MAWVYGMAPYLVAAWTFTIGLYGVLTSRNLVHLVVCLAVTQTSTYPLLLGMGYRIGAKAPVFIDIPLDTPAVDPVVQALMLTDVVVEATVLALLLAISLLVHGRAGTLDPDEIHRMRG